MISRLVYNVRCRGEHRVRHGGGSDERAKHSITEAQLKRLIRLWVDAQG